MHQNDYFDGIQPRVLTNWRVIVGVLANVHVVTSLGTVYNQISPAIYTRTVQHPSTLKYVYTQTHNERRLGSQPRQ
jgi:hypothetical protein